MTDRNLLKNKIENQLEINKWNIYLAKFPFLEGEGTKIRPVVALAIRDIAIFALPLTTNLENKTSVDVCVNFNNQKGLIKVDSLQRIHKKNIIKPFYSVHTGKRIRITKCLQTKILVNLQILFRK